MKVINSKDEKAVEEAAEVLKKGGVIIYPTETLYGMGANATDSNSVKKIFEIKGRGFNKPVSIAVGSTAQAKKIAEWNEHAEKLAKKFLPGPLTLILKLKKKNPGELTAGSDKIGIRIPDNPFALSLLKKIKFPITATSANKSGGREPTNAKMAIEQIGKFVDLVIDAGSCKYKKPSTVIDLTNKPKILRIGAISKIEIEKILR